MCCCFCICQLRNYLLNRFLSKHFLYIAGCIMHYIYVFVSISVVALCLSEMMVSVCIQLVSVSHVLKCAHCSHINCTLRKPKTELGLIVYHTF